MMRFRGLVIAGLAMALVSCSEPASEDAGPASTGPSESVPPVQPGKARQILQRGVDAIVAEPRTGFHFEHRLGQVPVLVIDGIADATIGWQATGRFTNPDSDSQDVMQARSVRASSWMQMEGWPAPSAGCWLLMEGQVPLGIQGLTPGEPGYISLLGYLHALGIHESSPNTLVGELDLGAASALLQAQLFEHITLDRSQAEEAKVPVEISYEGSRLSEVRMLGTDVVAAIEAAGGEVRSVSLTALDNSTFAVQYPGRAGGFNLTEPPADLVFTQGSPGCR